MKSTDRRYKKTESVILNAMVSLLSKKDYEAITIGELAEMADVNRSTFYLHYASLDDVMSAIEDRTIVLFSPLTNLFSSSPNLLIQALIDLLAENKPLFTAVAKGRSTRYAEKLNALFLPYFSHPISGKSKNNKDPKLLKALTLFGACQSVLSAWLTGEIKLPKEKISGELISLLESPYYKDFINR